MLRAPKTRSAAFWSTTVTANVEMNAVISKSTPALPIRGRTLTRSITTPRTKVTTVARSRPTSGGSPAPWKVIQATYPPTIRATPWAMFRVRRVP